VSIVPKEENSRCYSYDCFFMNYVIYTSQDYEELYDNNQLSTVNGKFMDAF